MASVIRPVGQGETPVLETRDLSVSFADRRVLDQVSLSIPERRVVALIGPSGSGKSTLLRCLNRMIDLVPDTHVRGTVLFRGEDIYDPAVDPAWVRRRIGIVFEDARIFPRSTYENVAFGLRLGGSVGGLEEAVRASLVAVGLWEEVRDRLHRPAQELSAGQRQRLCIARALALRPDALLLDEPTGALDPVAAQRIEALILQLRSRCAVVVVTHSPQQAARIADFTGFLHQGRLVEYGPTDRIFTNPEEPRTEAFVTGRLT